jgi:hypothetical protein
VNATAKISATLFLAIALSLGLSSAVNSTASAQGQEEMNEAIEHLRQAKGALEHAAANKGGHRESAVHLIDQAIAEVEAGKAYAKEHPGGEKHPDHDHD